jgi:hypothetical protein
MKHRWLLVAAAAALSGVAGCYKTPKPNCTFSCGSSGECPTDYMCGPDQVCHLVQSGGGLAACDHPFDDAAPVADAPQTDASPIDTAVADASPIDAKPDGMFDAMPDGMFDANTCPALAIMDDGTQGAGGQDLVISLVQPNTGMKIELYNTTGADIDLSAKTYELVSATQSMALTTGTVKSHGYLSVDWTFGDQTGGGEVVLYHSATHTPSNLDDFICWDTDGAGANSAKADAQSVNKWNAAGTCVGALTGTAIERKNDVTGVNATDYDPASSRAARNCP